MWSAALNHLGLHDAKLNLELIPPGRALNLCDPTLFAYHLAFLSKTTFAFRFRKRILFGWKQNPHDPQWYSICELKLLSYTKRLSTFKKRF